MTAPTRSQRKRDRGIGTSLSYRVGGVTERPHTTSLRVMRRELRVLGVAGDLLDTVERLRPKTRGECIGGERPCPFVACRWHLYLDVNPRTGSVTLNFPGAALEDLPDTCCLDVADRGGATLEQVAALTNATRERIRQIEELALLRLAGLAA